MSKKTSRNTKKALKALKRKRSNRAYYVSGGVMGVDTPEGQKYFRFNAYTGGRAETDTDGNGIPDIYEPKEPEPEPEPDKNIDTSDPAADFLAEPLPALPEVQPMEVSKVGETTVTNYDAMANFIEQNSQAAQDFGIKYSYDPETKRFVEDIGGFGFEGDMRYKYYTPEEFASRFNIDMSKYQTQEMSPSLITQKDDIQEIKEQDGITVDSITATDAVTQQATTEQASAPELGVPQGYSLTAPEGMMYPQVMPAEGKVFAYNKETGERIEIDQPGAKTYEAVEAGEVEPTKAAQLESLSPEALAAVEEQTKLTQEAEAAQATQAEIDAALGTAATRPDSQEYMKAVTSSEEYKVLLAEDPVAAQRVANLISEREAQDLMDIISKEGVNLEDIPEFLLAATRTAQVGEAKKGISTQLGDTPSVDFEGRQAITGETPQGDASQIGGIPTMAASSMQAVTGTARTAAAADMLAVVGNMPPEVTAALSEDPATVEAQLDTGKDPQVVAAVAALPPEALVSVQMENLLAGMEEGKTPAWARPAVAAIEQQMAQRGLSASTVGRDALFNAIIQSALPIAQSNAQALQQRAAQNLSNEQQANLASAQNTMQIRMQNLANRQTAASQTADMAQQIKLQQGQFRQQAKMTTADQQQQVRMQNIQNAQQRASQESAQRQQVALANLDTGTRMDLANLEALNMAGRENLSAEQQTKLTNYQAKVNRIMRQTELDQDMSKANLDANLRMEMMNLTEQNAAARDTMTAENQARLSNLQVLVDFKKTNAQLAQQMDLANLNNDQQMELANLSEKAAADSANMTEANRFRLQELTTYTNVMSQNAELRQRAEMAQLSAAEKVSLANLTAKNQADSENMNAQNMAELASYEKRMQAAQVNAQLAQQMGLANLSNQQAAAMFNAQIDANMDMKQFDANQQMALANSQFMQSMTMKNLDNRQQAAMQNATAMASLDLANVDQRTKLAVQNAQAFLALDMTNLENSQQAVILDQQIRQQTMLSNQAAENASRQFNATSENQTNQFMASMEATMNQFNASQANAMSQFNASETNRMNAINAGNQLEAARFNSQIALQADQFNAETEFRRDQWNAANAQAIEQANINWRRQANLADTAAQNAANQMAAQQSFQLSAAEQSFLWQQLSDEANYLRQAYENDQQRRTTLFATALANESEAGASRNIQSLVTSIINALGG